jgi:hypothetical protein
MVNNYNSKLKFGGAGEAPFIIGAGGTQIKIAEPLL